jgi:hypothetical protein
MFHVEDRAGGARSLPDETLVITRRDLDAAIVHGCFPLKKWTSSAWYPHLS